MRQNKLQSRSRAAMTHPRYEAAKLRLGANYCSSGQIGLKLALSASLQSIQLASTPAYQRIAITMHLCVA